MNKYEMKTDTFMLTISFFGVLIVFKWIAGYSN